MKVLVRLSDTSSQVRVRLAVLLLLAAVVVASEFGFEAILGAFLAGAVLAIAVSTWENEEGFRSKMEAVGFGFFVPVFFINSGMNFGLSGLAKWEELERIPVFLLVMLAARGIPALLSRRDIPPRQTLPAGLLQATNLPALAHRFLPTRTQSPSLSTQPATKRCDRERGQPAWT